MLKRLAIAVVTVALVVVVSPAISRADTIGTLSLIGCGTSGAGCPNATYTFDIGTTSASLSIYITGTVNSQNYQIVGVDLGFTPSNTISGLTLYSDPGGTWSTTTGSLSNNGCGTNSGSFICSSSSSGGVSIAQWGTYTWVWQYDSIDPSSIAAISEVHVGANYDPHNGYIVSQTGATSIPEPASFGLIAFGILGLVGVGSLKARRGSAP